MMIQSEGCCHPGELAVQKTLGVPSETTGRIEAIFARVDSKEIYARNANIIEQSQQFALGTLDARGRPWVTTIVGDFTPRTKQLTLSLDAPNGDPLRECLESGLQMPNGDMLWAGLVLGPDDRDRVKLGGRLKRQDAASEASRSDRLDSVISGRSSLDIELEVNMVGPNCPKYITERQLFKRAAGEATAVAGEGENVPLDAGSQTILRAADTFFVASRHLGQDNGATSAASMDTNHRGGRAGFVRLEADGTTLVWPEYSGNRFYSTLGNISTDGKAGLLFPDYVTGDVLHVTGNAEILIGPAASAVMPRCNVVVRVAITGWVRISGCIAVQRVKEEASPYSPPVRPLASELRAAGRGALVGASAATAIGAFGQNGAGEAAAQMAAAAEEAAAPLVKLVRATKLTPTIATFEFEVPATSIEGGNFRAGQFGMFDFSAARSADYAHMKGDDPQSINDDLVRTWTLSAPPAPPIDGSSNWIVQITVRLVLDGAVSPLLHQQVQVQSSLVSTLCDVRFLGIGGAFSNRKATGAPRHPGKQLWLGAGVGVTPFMAMLGANSGDDNDNKADMILSLRRKDVSLVRSFAEGISVVSHLRVFISDGDSEAVNQIMAWAGDSTPGRVEVHSRVLTASDIAAVVTKSHPSGGVYMCGPPGLIKAATGWLSDASVPEKLVHHENFNF